ncbi:DUF1871 family protein [Robertmurraya massiliosenegalensis]|uniref:DUF1871 family protein n=1 Tax=Robertmurraya TaxID=2837507 RepID=UPI0039A46165
MEMLETNLKLVLTLKKWDPFRLGEEAYDPEIADSIAAVHFMEEEGVLAEKIQEIYEFSFEERIPLEKCQQLARELLAIKNEGSCSI